MLQIWAVLVVVALCAGGAGAQTGEPRTLMHADEAGNVVLTTEPGRDVIVNGVPMSAITEMRADLAALREQLRTANATMTALATAIGIT